MQPLNNDIPTPQTVIRPGRRLLQLPLLVSVLWLISGCTHQAMNHAIASWQDRQVAEVTAAWGKPSEELKLEGKQLLIWNTAAGKPVPSETKSSAAPADATVCTRLLQADRKGRIVSGTWDGDDCPGWFSGWARW